MTPQPAPTHEDPGADLRIADAALRLPEAQRSDYIREACAGNEALLKRVGELLSTRTTETASTVPVPKDAPSRTPAQLKPGDRLGNRFVVVQFLASGGMGEVYEVIDEHLQGKHFALKTLRPEIAANPEMRQRFEREVLIAQEVNHRNVCPTHHLARLTGPHGVEIMCLTMKLLRGESLGARLRRLGPIGLSEALPIARQIAAGLDAAHAANVIHRDLKPGNVMIEDRGEDPQVWLMDFGISRIYDSDHTFGKIGQVAGTHGYLAPELFEGRTASPASDIYAFGVLLHEMLTGRQPLVKPGHSGVTKPSGLVAGLPHAWDRAILGCLERDPAKRFHSAREAIRVLDPSVTASKINIAGARVPNRLFRAAVIAGGFALVALGVWAASNFQRWVHPLPQKRHVALMFSEELAARTAGKPDAQQAALTANLLEGVTRRLVRSEVSVHDLLILGPSDLRTTQKFSRPEDAMRGLGANLILAISLESHGAGSRLSLRVLDLTSNKPLRTGYVDFESKDVEEVPERAADKAASLLDIGKIPPAPPDDADSLPPHAWQLFSAAEELRRQPNDTGLDQAIETYGQVLETVPHFASGFAQLAAANIRKYQLYKDPAALEMADKNAEIAVGLNPDLPRVAVARALVFLYSGRAPQALEWLDRALRADPGNQDILLYRARAFRDLKRPDDEERTYREIIHDRPGYWRAYNELGIFLARRARYQESADALGSAAQAAPRLALPLANRGIAYLKLGKRSDAVAAFQSSLERAPTAIAYSSLGSIAFEDGDYKKALDAYQHGLALDPRSDLMLRNIGDCWSVLGNSREMIRNYANAADLLSALLKTNPRDAASRMTLAFYEAKLEHHEGALADITKAEEGGATDVQSQFVKAQALAVLGRKSEAIATLISCIEKGESMLDVNLALDLREIRTDPEFQKKLPKTLAETMYKTVH